MLMLNEFRERLAPAERRIPHNHAGCRGAVGIRRRVPSTVLAGFVLLAGDSTSGQAPPAGALSESLARIVVDRAEAGLRWQYLDEGPHAVTQRDLHYKFTGLFTVNLTRSGGLYVRLRSETGDTFNNDHNYTAVGLGKRINSFNVKNILAGWRIGEQLEFQAGGIEYGYGAGTQATYADNDGWLGGYRLIWRLPGPPALPERISVAAGYVGDFEQPNFFRRFDRLKQVNYLQILAEKPIGKQTATSVEVSGFSGVPYFRGGLRRNTSQLKVIDDIVVEGIVRTARNRTFGWSSTVSRRLDYRKRWRVAVAWSRVPRSMFDREGALLLQNGDSMGVGKRLGATLYFSPRPNWEIVGFASRRLDATPGVRNRVQVVLRYQLADLLNSLLGAVRGR